MNVDEAQLVRKARASKKKTKRLRNRLHEFQSESFRLRAQARDLQQEAERQEQQAQRLQQQAERQQQEAQRLLEEAEHNNEEIETLKKDCEEANSVQLHLEFQTLCLALRRNDPETRILDRMANHDPPGYARVPGYVLPLGEALRGNTMVSVLYLRACNLLGNIDFDNAATGIECIAPLVNFVSTSTTLRCVRLVDGLREHWDDHLIAAFLRAVGNSSSIQELTCECQLPSEAFHHMVRATTSLRKLDLSFLIDRNDEYDQDQLVDLANAFRSNQSLESLRLSRDCAPPQVLQILSAVPDHPTLQELELHGSNIQTMTHWNGLCSCICSMRQLHHLKLVEFEFTAEKMRAFLRCFVRQDGTDAWCSSMNKLSNDEWEWDNESTALFVEFLKMEVPSDDTPPSVAPLRELRIDDANGSRWLTGPLVASLLIPRPCDGATEQYNQRWTVGSRLTSLSMDVFNFEGFLEALEISATEVRLDTLRLYDLGVGDCNLLKKCVDRMPCLRRVRLARVEDPVTCAHIILHMLRESGGLQTFVVEEDCFDSENGVLFDVAGLRLAEAYCQRNRSLGALLDREAESGQPTTSDRTVQALYPTLLQASKQIPKSRVLSLSSSLEKLGDCIGPE
jgi:hypothetical protein